MATYTVKSGDTLSGIAKQQGVAINQITGYKSGNPSLIYPGEVLTLGSASPAPSSGTTAITTQPKTTAGAAPVVSTAGKQVGGWYDNPATGKNMRWWGGDSWTMGEEPNLPKSVDQVSGYLNDYQNSLLKTPETRMADIKALTTPSMAAPAPLNRVAAFEQLRTEQGVADLEATVNDLKAQQDELNAVFRQQKTAEEGKPVAMNVISGRIGEEERQYNERMDYLGRQLSRATDSLNTKYNLVNTYMNLMGLDYQDAVDRYDKEFSQNLQIYQLVKGDIADERDMAKANLQLYANAITSGNLNYSNLDTTQKLMISKLEVQSGLPSGFVAGLQMNAKDRLIQINEKTGEALMIDQNGKFQIVKTGMTPTGTGTATNAQERALEADLARGMTLDEAMNTYRAKGLAPNTIFSKYNKLSTEGEAKEPDDYLRNKYNITDFSSRAGTTKSTVTASDINKAKQIGLRNGLSDDDLKRLETDPDYVNWVLANGG